MAGILTTTFFLVPRFGTQATLQVLCAVSAAAGVIGLVAKRSTALLALAPLAALPFAPEVKLPEGVIWRSESAYNLVWVVRRGDLSWLVLNDGRFFQTIRKENTVWTGYCHDDFALGPLLVPARRLLVLGMGAGGSIATARAIAPHLEVDAVEIDPKVVEAAVRFFGLRPAEPQLRIHVADARPWLAQAPDRYELVHIDLYHGGPYIPFYLTTVEFYRLVRARMSEEGLLMMNVFDASKNRELLFATGATLRRVFPSVAVVSRADKNHIVFAFPQARSVTSVRARLEAVQGGGQVKELAQRAAASIIDLVPPAGTVVLTDDHAPVEEMTRRMLLRSGL
jgi:spermidine synthase